MGEVPLCHRADLIHVRKHRTQQVTQRGRLIGATLPGGMVRLQRAQRDDDGVHLLARQVSNDILLRGFLQSLAQRRQFQCQQVVQSTRQVLAEQSVEDELINDIGLDMTSGAFDEPLDVPPIDTRIGSEKSDIFLGQVLLGHIAQQRRNVAKQAIKF